jgi:4-carboxymuconolactone decarboxylase
MIHLRAVHAAVLSLAGLAFAQTSQTPNFTLRGDRFRPLTWQEMTTPQRTMIEHLLSGERGGTGGPFNVMLRSPEMGDAAQSLGASLRFHSSLPPKLREMAILMTGRRLTAQYEFYAHRPLAIQAGLSAAVVDAIAAGRRPTALAPDEEAVYEFSDQLLHAYQVTDAAFQAVKDQLGERGVVDLTALVGYYHLVSMMLNVDRYPLPDGAKPPLEPLRDPR